MLSNELMPDEKILVITPGGALQAADFEQLVKEVDPYIAKNGKLNGLMIYAENFLGWENFEALLSHIKFVKNHHQHIEKVAAVTDSGFLSILPRVANHFIQAKVGHFAYHDKDAALDWLKSDSD